MRQQYTWNDFVYFLKRGHMPATIAIILVCSFMFVANAVSSWGGRVDLLALLGFVAPGWTMQPWTLFTYPFICGQGCLLNLIFGAFWLWFVGGSLERGWGTRVYLYFFFLISAITALSISVGVSIVGTPVPLLSLWMPLAALTVAWGTLDPEQQILLYFIIPLKAKYLAWLDVAIVFFTYARIHPIIGLFALAGCAASWQYVLYRWRSPRRSRPQTSVVRVYRRKFRFPNPFRRVQERKDQERLRKLFGEDKDDHGNWR